MLLKILIMRLTPLFLLLFIKERIWKKRVVGILLILYGICFLVTATTVFKQKQWIGILALVLSAFPQWVMYIFSFWIIARCVWQVWSIRVWKRIGFLSVLCVLIGVLSENYLNSKILELFFRIFK